MVFESFISTRVPLQELNTHDWHLEIVSWKFKSPPIYLRYNENVI